MSEGTATLKLRTQVEIAQLREYIRLMRESAAATREMTDAARDYQGVSGQGPGTGGGAAPAGSPSTGAGGGAPPPQPARGGGGTGAAAGAPPPRHQPAEAGSGSTYEPANAGPWLRRRRDPMDDLPPDLPEAPSGGARRFLTSGVARGAAAVTGLALGGSMIGFAFSSVSKYIEVSKVATQIRHRFREAEESVMRFGATFGHTAAETGAIATALGQQINDMRDGSSFKQVAGFARFTGMDPTAAAGGLGRMQQFQGSALTRGQLGGMMGLAGAANMGQGRLGEQLSTIASIMETQLRIGGAAGTDNAAGMLGMVASMYRDQDGNVSALGQGGMAQDFLSRANAGITGTQATQSLLMRRMGFGRPGGEDFLSAMKRLERGAFDPDNLSEIMQQTQDMGLGRTGAIQMLQGATGGQLKWHELEKFYDRFGSEEGIGDLRSMMSGDNKAAMGDFMKDLSPAARRRFESAGFEGLGSVQVSAGEAAMVRLENLQAQIGRPMLTAIETSRDVLEDLFSAYSNLTGIKWHDLVEGVDNISKTITRISGWIEQATQTGGVVEKFVSKPGKDMGDLWDDVGYLQEHAGTGAAMLQAIQGLVNMRYTGRYEQLDRNSVPNTGAPPNGYSMNEYYGGATSRGNR